MFYTVNEGEFTTSTRIEVTVVGEADPISVFVSIGIVPTKERNQYACKSI